MVFSSVVVIICNCLLTCQKLVLAQFLSFTTLILLVISLLAGSSSHSHIQSSGWQVIVSSSFIDPRFIDQLQDSGIKLAFRHNIGFCLGAYRDLSLLLKSSPSLSNRITSLAFINDSNLLIHPPSVLTNYLNQLTLSEEYKPVPILAGLTDSAQLNSYHIQSFFLYANKALLDSPQWFRFWSNLAVDSSKEKLILNGEIGLSQYFLSCGFTLKVLFPLAQKICFIIIQCRRSCSVMVFINHTMSTKPYLLGDPFWSVVIRLSKNMYYFNFSRIAAID